MNITLGTLVKKIMKKWYIIASTILVMIVAALIYSVYIVDANYVNTATATLKYNNSVASTGYISDADFNQMQRLMLDDEFNETIIEKLGAYGIAGLDIYNIDLEKIIVLKEGSKSSLITFTSSYSDAELSYEILTAYVNILQNDLNPYNLYGNVDVYFAIGIIEDASIINLNDNMAKMLILAVGIAIMFSVIGLVVYFITARNLKNIMDFQSEFDIKVLGIITFDNDGNMTCDGENKKSVTLEHLNNKDEEVCHDGE